MDPKGKNPNAVPYDEGEELVARAHARKDFEKNRERSPVQFYDEALLCRTAALLSSAPQSKRTVTACQLEMKLRECVTFMQDVSHATVRTEASFEDDEQSSSPTAADVGIPDAKLKKIAKKKHEQARRAVEKAIELLKSEEVSAFARFDEDASERLWDELNPLVTHIREPIGLKRGHPFLADVVMVLHQMLYDLAGSWLRGPRTDNRQDEFLQNLLFDLLRPITPNEITEEGIRSAIETGIKSKKPRISET